MICLSMDTSSRTASVALLEDREIIYSQMLNDGRTHSEKLMPMIEACFEITGRNIRGVDFFTVINGPGSFTGVRIAVAAAKGFAQAGNKPVSAVSALDALNYAVGFFPGVSVPLIDARGGQVYAGAYGNGGALMPPKALHIGELLDELAGLEGPFIFTGDGALANREAISDALCGRAVFAPGSLIYPDAACAGMLGFDLMEKGLVTDYMSLSPEYIRKSSAERNLDKRNKRQ